MKTILFRTFLMAMALGFSLTAGAQAPNANLVAYWPLNDGTNGQSVTGADDVMDAGLTFTNATVEGSGGTWSNDPTRGIVFSTGENDRLVGGTQGIDLNDGFTWSLWVNLAESNKSDPGADVVIGTRNGNPFNKLQISSIANWVSVSGYNLADDTWHHVALVGDTNGVGLYIDGRFFGEDTSPASQTFNGKLEFGGSSGFSEDVTGLISDVAIWREALSTNRIMALAAGGEVILDETPPVVSGLSPTNNAIGVSVDVNLSATFDDPVTTVAGTVVITNLTDSTNIVISVPGPDPDGVVWTVGNVLRIDPTVRLGTSKTYAVTIDPALVENETGYDFAGITNDTTWRFTTGGPDLSGPTFSSSNPSNGATRVHVAADLMGTFSENIVQLNGGVITISNLTEGTGTTITLPDARVSTFAEDLTIDLSVDLEYGDTYAVFIDANTLEDMSGNGFAGILDDMTWRFIADTPPAISALNPADNAVGVGTRSNLVATFDEDVVLIEGGVFVVTNLTEGTAETMVYQETLPTIPNRNFQVSGTVVTINPDSHLQPGDQYAVHIGTNAIEDLAGNLFAGINDDVTWNFTADSDPNANLVAYWPLNDGANGEDVTNADDIIDNPDHPATDAVAGGSGGTWVNDLTRGIVFSTTSSDRLNAGNMGIIGDFTWSVWVKTSDGGNNILGTRSGTYFRLFATRVSGDWVNFDFAPDAHDGEWRHLVLRRRGDTMAVWVDGVLGGSKNRPGALNSKLEIGGTSTYPGDFTGLISDAAIWNEALSTNRIADLAAGGAVILSGLEIRKSVSAPLVSLDQGPTNLSYTLHVANSFTSAFGGVTVTDALPSEVSFISSVPPANQTNGNELVFDIGTLTSGANFEITIDVLVTSTVPSVITNFAMVGTTNTNVVLTATLDTAETLLYRPTDLSLTKTLWSTQSNLYYTLTVSNQSLATAENVTVVDTLPPDTMFDSSLPPPDSVSGNDYTFDLGTLLAGAVTTIDLTLVYTSSLPATVTNTASVMTTSLEDNLANNTNTLVSLIGEGVDLDLTKIVNITNLIGGVTNLTYTLTVNNIGTTQAISVVVTDSLPAGVEFVMATPSPVTNSGNDYTFDLGSIASGAGSTIVIDAVYTSSVVGVILTNWASVFTPTQELSLANNTDWAETSVPDPFVDTDGDGMTDNDEFIAGTLPLDSNSFLWVKIVRTSETVRVLTFPGVTGRTYHVQTRTNLYLESWTDVQTGIPGPPVSNEMMYILRTNPLDRVYYRIGAETP